MNSYFPINTSPFSRYFDIDCFLKHVLCMDYGWRLYQSANNLGRTPSKNEPGLNVTFPSIINIMNLDISIS